MKKTILIVLRDNGEIEVTAQKKLTPIELIKAINTLNQHFLQDKYHIKQVKP